MNSVSGDHLLCESKTQASRPIPSQGSVVRRSRVIPTGNDPIASHLVEHATNATGSSTWYRNVRTRRTSNGRKHLTDVWGIAAVQCALSDVRRLNQVRFRKRSETRWFSVNQGNDLAPVGNVTTVVARVPILFAPRHSSSSCWRESWVCSALARCNPTTMH